MLFPTGGSKSKKKNFPRSRLVAGVRFFQGSCLKKLNKMINTEKLLVDYTIQRVCDDIYLQWK
jgi:hypothetical protein